MAMSMSKKVARKKLKKIDIGQQESLIERGQSGPDLELEYGVPDSDQSGEMKASNKGSLGNSDKASKMKSSSKERLEDDFQRRMNLEFQKDLETSVSESYLEQVSIDKGDDDETEGELEFEQTPDTEQKLLYFGKASYRNMYNDPKKQEERNWITWETFSAISGMEVSELVRRAEISDLVLDERGLARIRKRFTSMSRMHKRQFYRCINGYVIPEQIPTWSEECKKSNIISNDVGDDSLNRKVALMRGDITTLEVDAVVNSISSFVTDNYEGVTKAIVSAASALLCYELESIKIIYSGHVKATAGYLLPAKYIFHTSGPTKDWAEDVEESLKNCYINSLNKLVEMGLRTLAFCCIATGAKKVNSRQAASIALTSVKRWLQENKDSVDKIIFCVYDIDNWASYQEFMPKIFPPSNVNDQSEASLLPIEILRMDKKSIELYKRALSEGKEAVYNIRVMVVGHYGVGKTTLTKRLFDEDVDINKRESTNGIDVHVRRCKVSLNTGQWNIFDKDHATDTTCQRLVNLLKRPFDTDDAAGVEHDDDVVGLGDNETAIGKTEEFDDVDGFITSENIGPDIPTKVKGTERVFTETDPEAALKPLKVKTVVTENFSTLEAKDENILRHLEDLIEGTRHSGATDDSNVADVSIWDFAGQYAFYATHQVFLSRRAVYLLVTDISKHVEETVKNDDCFLDSKGVKQWKISEFVDFWLNSIHEFCGSAEDGGPPVLLVGTFADKLEQESKKETIDEFFYTLRCSLLDKVTSGHLIEKDFAIDNTIKDDNMDMLKQQIVETASEQSYWGELIPAKWIALENNLTGLKGKGTKVLTKDEFRHLNNSLPVPIETEEELELFLRFHHESGNILYYCDNMLNDSIVLDPQWLIDAFKSLITAKMFCCRKPEVLKKWIQFDQSAILTRELVDVIWKQSGNEEFYRHRNLLLNYLEKLGFIAKPPKCPRDTTSDTTVPEYYFAPCVLKHPPSDDLLTTEESKELKSTSKLCLTTELRFLPTAVFSKLLAACINKWPLAKADKKYLIFCGCAVFDLEGNHTLHIYFFDHIIQIWITKLSTQNEEPSRDLCSQVYAFVLDVLSRNLNLSNHVKVFFRCRSSEHNSNENMFSEDEILPTTEIVCKCRERRHVLQTCELRKYWYNTEERNNPSSLTDKDINRIAQNIGREYESLAIELGLSQAELDHINIDSRTTVDRIRRVLVRWRDMMKDEADLDALTEAMKAVGIDYSSVLESETTPLKI